MPKKAIEPKAVVPLGDCAAYIEFADRLDLEVNAFVQQLAAASRCTTTPTIPTCMATRSRPPRSWCRNA